jgi:3-isopropylmalate/(R)-2-methylmalate dehydratase small subunit
MNQEELKRRTKQFALQIIKLAGELPKTLIGKIISSQLVRAGTAVGANYRAACRSRSCPEFIAKLGIVEEEADECGYWLELIVEGGLLPLIQVQPLLKESHELVAIMAASIKTAKRDKEHYSMPANNKSAIPRCAGQVSNQQSAVGNQQSRDARDKSATCPAKGGISSQQSEIINHKSAIIRGPVYVVGDNIDTDQIIPAQHLNLVPTIPEEYQKLGALALSGLPPEYPPLVAPGADRAEFVIVIGGRNFGCGSSREHAPIALGAAGIQAVVAESYARIFFRNSIATGEFYPLESALSLRQVFHTGDLAEIDLEQDTITQLGSGKSFALKPLGAAKAVVEAGGLFAHARKTGMIK